MKWLNEFRDATKVQSIIKQITQRVTRPHTIMEVCGGQTHTIVKYALESLLPDEIRLIHGPGCPVCVTPIGLIDKALALAAKPEVIFCSFGDMLRVPGSSHDLRTVKARGGDVRIVYSPLDALQLAKQHPDKEVIFFSIGFETTAPTTAMSVYAAAQQGISNYSILASHVLVPPALEAILTSPNNQVQGFLAAGHVCTVMGYHEYPVITKTHQVPIVVTGFEPLDVLHGIDLVIAQLEEGRAEVENQYSRYVQEQGNLPAQQMVQRIFQVVHRDWRGIGVIPNSGLGLREEYAPYDADKKFELKEVTSICSNECKSGLILQGQLKPPECPAFGTRCTPEHPLGAPMVSSEGACAAYFQYQHIS